MTAFDDHDRKRIREALIETGRERFARYGLRKTTIADLTEPAGITTGTFYRFFDSKEELFWTVSRPNVRASSSATRRRSRPPRGPRRRSSPS